jgi:hypothetical protein
MPLRDDLVIAKFNSANLGDTVSVRPAAGCFDVDDNIILLRIEPEIDAGDLGFYTGVTKLAQARELVAARGTKKVERTWSRTGRRCAWISPNETLLHRHCHALPRGVGARFSSPQTDRATHGCELADKLDQRFLGSNHIRPRPQVCRTKYG